MKRTLLFAASCLAAISLRAETVTYTITEVDQEAAKTYSSIEIHNQRGELCAVGKHILKFFDAPLA